MTQPLKLFISYRSLDSDKVDAIVNALKSMRATDSTPVYTTWQDKKDMPVGQNWWESIVDAIIDCDVFVFHISQEALKSEVCKAELAYALQRNRFIIPVVLEGEFFYNFATGKNDIGYWPLMPERLKPIHFLFYTGAAFFKQFDKTIEQYKRNPPRDVKAPRPLNPESSGGGSAVRMCMTRRAIMLDGWRLMKRGYGFSGWPTIRMMILRPTHMNG